GRGDEDESGQSARESPRQSGMRRGDTEPLQNHRDEERDRRREVVELLDPLDREAGRDDRENGEEEPAPTRARARGEEERRQRRGAEDLEPPEPRPEDAHGVARVAREAHGPFRGPPA